LIYIAQDSSLLEPILMVLVVGIFVFNYNILIPVFTKNVLHQGEKIYGFLMGALGVGSLAGALMVSIKSKTGPKIKTLIMSSMMISVLLILVGFSKTSYISAILLVFTGLFNIWFSTTANSTLQLNTNDEYRGRVMSVYSLVFAGATPIGNMFAGLTSEKFGASGSFILSGIVTIILISLLLLISKIKKHRRNLSIN